MKIYTYLLVYIYKDIQIYIRKYIQYTYLYSRYIHIYIYIPVSFNNFP